MNLKQDSERSHFFSTGPKAWQVFMNEHESVKEWLTCKPLGTRSLYGRKLLHFCEVLDISREEFLRLDRFEARDSVWQFIEPFIKEPSSKAKNNSDALKSFYSSKDEETLPFDSVLHH